MGFGELTDQLPDQAGQLSAQLIMIFESSQVTKYSAIGFFELIVFRIVNVSRNQLKNMILKSGQPTTFLLPGTTTI